MILFVSALNGCGHIQIPDEEYCGDLGPEGASCFHMFSDGERDIPKEEWDRIRFEESMVCSTAKAFGNIKATLLKLCRVSRRCTYEQWEALTRLSFVLDELQERNWANANGVAREQIQWADIKEGLNED